MISVVNSYKTPPDAITTTEPVEWTWDNVNSYKCCLDLLPVLLKPLTFEGQTSWTISKTQFDVVSSTNGWTDFVKASQLVASFRGSEAEVFHGIPADKLTDLTTIEDALESRFGDIHPSQFYRRRR
ncbi:hypothetical protein AVEN_36134-1 [Araneus ventricosus]|uniref:Uncharacterized protein n=1 Tax=Araneus ventricosus TaxID=182803 RepID=A0A4Y2EIT6_ARAVE|nr:hypothetical protein AVEN_36134-1 [Araneus ventricosus]